ncbi:MAG TPA: 6,7-dimethyl-8-ribityllumazine synthase [Candidatus Saccharimonadales bacterium]|nr:6,7-dimethyl-8-ribityllumazine synthase [Candidatus Saccharimonadales bacterium]
MQKAKRSLFEPFDASKWCLGIVVADFNAHITDALYQSALQRATDYHLPVSNIDTVRVAGSIEIPLVLQTLAKTGRYQALLAIGCVIRGETPHFDYVCQFVSEGVLRVQLDHDMPIGFGVLTCNNEAEALARTGLGGEHLDAVLHQAKALEALKTN